MPFPTKLKPNGYALSLLFGVVVLAATLCGCGPEKPDPTNEKSEGNRDKPRSTASLLSPSASTAPTPTPTPSAGPESDGGTPANLWGTAIVTRVIDGDTVELRKTDGPTTGQLETVRLLGIDSPETKHPTTGPQCWGTESTALATRILLGQQVKVILDPTQDQRDKYARLLAYVITRTGVNYSIYAAEQGVARRYVYNGQQVLEDWQIEAGEQIAKRAKKGLWGPPCNGGLALPGAKPAGIVGKKPAAPAPKPSEAIDPPAEPDPDYVYYANCSAAKRAGAAPLHRGDAGYRAGLDRDNDGVACES